MLKKSRRFYVLFVLLSAYFRPSVIFHNRQFGSFIYFFRKIRGYSLLFLQKVRENPESLFEIFVILPKDFMEKMREKNLFFQSYLLNFSVLSAIMIPKTVQSVVLCFMFVFREPVRTVPAVLPQSGQYHVTGGFNFEN